MEEQIGTQVLSSISNLFTSEPPYPKSFNLPGGSKIYLHSNYHQVKCNFSSTLYKYNVITEPNIIDREIICKHVCKILFPDGGNMNSNEEWRKNLFNGNGTLISLENDLEKEGNVDDMKIRIVYEKELKINENKEDLAIVLKEILDKSFLAKGHSCLDSEYFIDTDYKDEGSVRFVRGYKPLLSLDDGNLFFSIDMAVKIDRKGALYDLINGEFDARKRKYLEDTIHQMKFVMGNLKQQKTVKIKNIKWDSKPQEEINEKTNGESLSKFFLKYYNIVSKPNDTVIELSNNQSCPATALIQNGLTDAEKQDKKIKDSLHKFIDLSPIDRKKYIESILNSIDVDELSRYDIKIEENIVLNGHILEQPLLTVRKNDITHEITKISGNDQMMFDLTDSSVTIPPRINSPPLIISPQNLSNKITKDFIPNLLDSCKKLDIIFPYPEYRSLNESFNNLILNYINNNQVPSFVLYISDSDSLNTSEYNKMKYFLTRTLGIPSQFVSDKILDSPSKFLQEVLLQITSKVGGVPFYVSLPLKHTMVIGISTIQKGNDYVISLTASYDQTYARYKSKCFMSKSLYLGENNDSKIHFQKFINESIQLFNEYFLENPSKIIIYRMVENNDNIVQSRTIELPFILKIVENVSLVFCTVQKNTPLRLFIDDGDTSENPLPGTVVFENICSSKISEFYLISNYTSMPVRYNILFNSSDKLFKDEHFVLLTYYLCCNNPTFPGTTRLPAPLHNSLKLSCFYSNVLGFENASDLLDKVLYYI